MSAVESGVGVVGLPRRGEEGEGGRRGALDRHGLGWFSSHPFFALVCSFVFHGHNIINNNNIKQNSYNKNSGNDKTIRSSGIRSNVRVGNTAAAVAARTILLGLVLVFLSPTDLVEAWHPLAQPVSPTRLTTAAPEKMDAEAHHCDPSNGSAVAPPVDPPVDTGRTNAADHCPAEEAGLDERADDILMDEQSAEQSRFLPLLLPSDLAYPVAGCLDDVIAEHAFARLDRLVNDSIPNKDAAASIIDTGSGRVPPYDTAGRGHALVWLPSLADVPPPLLPLTLINSLLGHLLGALVPANWQSIVSKRLSVGRQEMVALEAIELVHLGQRERPGPTGRVVTVRYPHEGVGCG